MLLTEGVDGRLAVPRPVGVHHDKASGDDPVVERLEHRAHLLRVARPDSEQGHVVKRCLGERARRRSFEEADAIVEQIEAGERLAYGVEVCRPGEVVGDPDARLGELVGVEKAAHEDCGATAARADVHEIALDRLLADEIQARPEMIEAHAAERRIREPVRTGSARGIGRKLTGLALLLEPLQRTHHVASRVRQLISVDRLSGAEALEQVLNAQLVLEVVLVEQGVPEQVEITARGPALSR